MTELQRQTVTATLTREGETVTLSLPDWPGGALSLTHDPQTGTVLTTHGAFTHVVNGDYTLLVSGQHTTMVGKSALLRTGGHAVTFTNKTIQLNPLSDRLLDFIARSEAKVANLLRRVLPPLRTQEVAAQKRLAIQQAVEEEAARAAAAEKNHAHTCGCGHCHGDFNDAPDKPAV